MTSLTVSAPGPLATVQDFGRSGQGALGVGRSGACDRQAHRLANALVGNHPTLATVEVTLGGLEVVAEGEHFVATTGARAPLTITGVDGARRGVANYAPFFLHDGEKLSLGVPPAGLRTYLAVRGGIDVEPVLESRSTDLLSGLGPAKLAAGTVLPVGRSDRAVPGVDVAATHEPREGVVTVRVLPGPRRDWFGDDGWASLTSQTWTATNESNRVGVRLDGEPLERLREGEMVSEGMLRGALQVPPSGLPVLFLADHPVTGGYPVIGYVHDDDVDRCGQLRPGQELRFRAST